MAQGPFRFLSSKFFPMKLLERKIINFLLCFCLSMSVVTQLSGLAFAQTKSIIAFGDSLTEGCDVHYFGSSVCGWNIGVSYGYENELRLLLQENGFDEFSVYNYGWGGETTSEGVNRLDDVLNSTCTEGAEYILIMEGTNDLLHHTGWPEVIFNLDVMVDKSRAAGIVPLLATLTPDPENVYKDIPLMNEKIREYAANKVPPVILVDQYNAVKPFWGVYTNPLGCYGDLIHPNPTGFDAIGTTWYKSLSEIFPKPPIYLPWLMLLLGAP